MQQTPPPALFSFNPVRRHFNESELGQFRAQTLISIHSLGTFSQDVSQEAKLLDPPWHCLQVPRGQAAKFMREADPLPFTDPLISSLLAFFCFFFLSPFQAHRYNY